MTRRVVPFTKMHGAGNDYVYVDAFEVDVPDPSAFARLVSPRRTGVGSDGLILLRKSDVADFRMEMYNADGSRAEMCGNGVRCAAALFYDRRRRAARGTTKIAVEAETDAGVKTVILGGPAGWTERGERPTSAGVGMGRAVLDAEKIPMAAAGRVVNRRIDTAAGAFEITAVGMGNPHAVVFVDDVRSLDLARLGPAVQAHAMFTAGVNVEFARVLAEDEAEVRVFERGSGETFACGTGACAVAVAGALTGRLGREVRVRMPGGNLGVSWDAETGAVILGGPVAFVFEGGIALD